ncbi:hypothetical protein [Rhizobium leguminosarum]|uniref:hypothetical protein n=1 Tax=Rhizobium leguminosarum TaxID=384 RepID=UPI002E1657AF|nr:hypothetical protein U8Q02_36520 [Rhizobium leguminosarum]
MTEVEDMIEVLKGVALDILHEVVVIDADISPGDYVATMIDAPIARAKEALRLEEGDKAHLVLEVAFKDLISNFDGDVLAVNSDDFDKPGYSVEVLRRRLTTTVGMTA